MALNWYYKNGDQQQGPFSVAQVKLMAQKNQITPKTLLRREDRTNWIEAAKVPGLFAAASPPPAAAAPVAAAPAPPRKAKPAPSKPLPKATPVAAAKPLQAKPLPAKLPQAKPAAAATPVYSTASKPSQPFVATEESTTQSRTKRRKSNSATLIMIGAVVCGMIVIVGVSYFALNISEEAPATNTVAQASVDQTAQPAPTSSNESEDVEAKVDPFASIEKWQDITKRAGLGKKGVRVQVVSAWLGDDLSGGSAITSGSDKPDYVFVQVKITNSGGDQMDYTSWNETGADSSEASGVMMDDQGTLCKFVSRAELDSDDRLRKKWIDPRSDVSDVLVFKPPVGEFEYLRLALPFSAVGMSGYAGFEIPGSSLEKSKPLASDVAANRRATAGAPMPAADDPSVAIPPIKLGKPNNSATEKPVVEQTADAKPDANADTDGQSDTIEDLLKSIEQSKESNEE